MLSHIIGHVTSYVTALSPMHRLDHAFPPCHLLTQEPKTAMLSFSFPGLALGWLVIPVGPFGEESSGGGGAA